MERVRFITRKNVYNYDEEIALIKDATIMAGANRNFSGQKTGPYDQLGARYLTVKFSDPTVAQELADHRYPINFDKNGEYAYLKVHIKPELWLPCVVKVINGSVENTLKPEDYAQLDGIKTGNDEYTDTIITSAELTLRLYEWKENRFSCQLEEGRFYLRPISEWDSDPFGDEF